MTTTFPRLSRPPSFLRDLLESLRRRGQDPRVLDLRWRLHLRLLLISAGLCAGLFALSLSQGRLDGTGPGGLLCLLAWAWLRRHPQHSRAVVRLNLAIFLTLGIYVKFGMDGPGAHWALLAMAVIPVFGALLDGLVGGGIATLVTMAAAAAALATGNTQDMPLAVAFVIPAALCLFTTSLTHTWFFDRIVSRQQRSADAVAAVGRATEHMARTLAEEVTQATQRLNQSLARGLEGLAQAQALSRALAQARAGLPEALPRSSVEPRQWLDRLRAQVHRAFLSVALAAGLAALATVLWMGVPLWELAALVALTAAALRWIGDVDGPRWLWRLYAFTAACLGVMAADVLLSVSPPAASLIFLPLLVFYASMLGPLWLGFTVWAAGAGLLALSWLLLPPTPGHGGKLVVLALTSLTLVAVSLATLPLYRRLLEGLHHEENLLRAGLQSYRRLVSTLFHDLANPLAVLQGLAALPQDLRAPDDLQRARRMVERLRAVSDTARFEAVSHQPPAPVSVATLADELNDLFSERLHDRGLSVKRGAGMDLQLRGGSLLRDSILSNLFSNAIKYSPPGGRIHLDAGRSMQGAWLRLRDQGPGFPAQVLDDLALGRSPQPHPGPGGELGSGFGLLLAQTYAQDLGGVLSLSNPPEGGALAELWLPD